MMNVTKVWERVTHKVKSIYSASVIPALKAAPSRWKKLPLFVRFLLLLALITLCAALLFLCWQNSAHTIWQYDSEGLVIGRMYQMQTGQGLRNPAGFLGGFDKAESENHDAACAYDQLGLYFDDVPVTAQEYWAYTHQPGAHGTLWGLANRALCLLKLPAQTRLGVLHFVSVWLLCAAVLAVCAWAKREWGMLPAILCGAGLLLSPWTLRACANLYWQLWLSVALFALAAYAARACERVGRISLAGLLALFGALLFRFLCGFEFASSVLVCVEVPFVYYFIKHWGGGKAARLQWLRSMVGTGLAGISAFAAAVLVWLYQLYVQLDSVGAAVAEMLAPIANRTGVLGAAQGEYGASLTTSFAEVLRLYTVDDTVLPGVSVLLLAAVYLFVLLAAVWLAVKQKRKTCLQTHAALFAAVVTGAAAVLSWLVLARGHAAVHPHINYILWLLPFVPVCCAHIGVCARELYGAVREEAEKRKGNAT